MERDRSGLRQTSAGGSHSAWPGVEFRHLAALVAVAREGSFRGAAERLGYVQSAVSQQIAQLEKLVGVSLVERRRGAMGVALTEPGQLLLGHCDEVMRRLRAAQSEIEALDAGRASLLKVGACETVALRLMPSILRRVIRRLPEVRVEIHESRVSTELAERVEAGELDLAFADPPPHPEAFARRDVIRDARVLLTPVSWPLAKSASVATAADLMDLPLIAPVGEPGADEIDQLLRAHGVIPRYVLRADTAAVVQAHVAEGVGAAIVPRLMVDESDDRVAVLDLDDLVPRRALAIYWQRDRSPSPAMLAFVEVAVSTSVEQVTGTPFRAMAA